MATRAGLDVGSLVRNDRVHGDVYLRPEILDQEMEKIFHRGWVYVGHAAEIPEPGDYRMTWIGLESVVMVRDQGGEVRLLMNRCRHRANAVCQADRGNANFFRCAYHGWTYKNTGELVGVTRRHRYGEEFVQEEMGLNPVPRMGAYRGFIWGSLSEAGITLDEHLGEPVKRELDSFCDLSPEGELDVRAGIHKSEYKANWKFQAENSVDGYHATFTHQQVSIGRGPRGASGDHSPYQGITKDLTRGHFTLWDPRYAWDFTQTAWGQEYLKSMEQRYGKERAEAILKQGGTHCYVFPNIAVMGMQIRVIRPITVDETEVFLHMVLLKGVPRELNAQRVRVHEGFYGPSGCGQPDDLEMFDRNQVGLSAKQNPWLLLSRGSGQEEQEADGVLVGERTDELPQRSFWKRWKQELMAP